MTKFLFLLFISYQTLYAAVDSNTKKPVYVNTSSFATNSDLPITIINNLLDKCSNKTIDQCDMCSLCQNDAFCRQKSKKLVSSTKPITTPKYSNPQQTLTYLKSQIDFTCYCVPGYTGSYCQIDINECLSMPCSNNATCIDRINSYECKCPSGYTGDNCEININECDSSPCNPDGGKCIDLIDGYFCNCNPGFTGPTCAVNINECASNPCFNNATCVDLINGFECNCTNTGYDGQFCENNINDCLNVECKHNSVCIDGINSFKCDCYPGYDGKYCEIDIDECLSSPCVYGKCWQNSDGQSLSRKYLLFNSNSSNLEFDENSLEAHFELNVNYSNAAGYWCECEPGYTGLYCEIKIDECQSSPCGPNGKCIDLVNGYKCICHSGYTGVTCTENIDECKLYNPCAENTKCVDLKPDYTSLVKTNKNLDDDLYLDGYYCDCTELNENLFKKNGNRDVLFAGQNCTLKLNACQSLKTKCQHDSQCQSILYNSTEQDIMCICKPGYTGKYCEYSTIFRLDGTYSIGQKLQESTQSIKFDFKINFFDRVRYPLIYFENSNQFLFEMILNRDYIEIRNDYLGLSQKIGFLYLDKDESYNTMWNKLEIIFDDGVVKIFYSIKQMQLKVQKTINLRKFGQNQIPTSFTIGKFYRSLPNVVYETDDRLSMDFEVNNYLSDACFRDFSINSEILYKSLKPDYLNHNFEIQNRDVRIKFGCNLRNHGIINEFQCQSDLNGYDETLNYCSNNSTCINRWFNYECQNCSLPFYGKNCQFESTKIIFVNQNTEYSRANEAILEINHSILSSLSESTDLNYFKIEFNLHRFSQQNQKLDKFFSFLTLKQKMSNPLVQNFYQIGIDYEGFISIQKIQLNHDQNLNQTLKLLWSLKNDKINLNQFNTSYTSLVSIKLNEKFVQLNVNNSAPVRIKLSQNQDYLEDSKFEIENVLFSSNFSSGYNFIFYDLVINSVGYHFRYMEPYRLELILLDNKQNFVYRTLDLFRVKNLIVLNKNDFKNDLRLIESLDCPIPHVNEGSYLMTNSTMSISKRKCFESLSVKFRDNFKLSNLLNVTCELKPISSDSVSTQSNSYYSTCEQYSSIKRRLTNRLGQISSFISYFFDFDTQNQGITLPKFNPLLTPNETLALINLTKQRRVVLLQDVDFYTLTFNLSLQPSQDFTALKTNLFTLNSLDDLTSNRIFLFGVNLYLTKKNNGLKYEFEIFTSKQSIKTDPIMFQNNIKVNLTFTFNSIELRLDSNSDYLIRLTDKYFNLFFRSLLKAYGSFQLNVTRIENYVSNSKSLNFINSCMSNFKIGTRKLMDETSLKYSYNSYDLIGQAKSVLTTKPDKSGLDFDSTCEFMTDLTKNSGVLDYETVPDNCFAVTEFDVTENKNLKDIVDCECDSNLDVECSFNFWSEKNSKINAQKMEIGFESDEEFRGCVESNEYACFNNGTCVDNYYADTTNKRESYRCLCRDSYTGKRCERYDPCLKNPCSLNSTCVPKYLTNDQISYECKCFPGFLGRNCTIKFDETCLSKPCMNGATCINITSFDEQTLSYECMCPLGYEGKRCDKKIDYCFLYEPCKNGATCTNKDSFHGSYYECSCAKGWKGVNCTQDIDECAAMKAKSITPCSGHGYCVNTPGSYKCNCNELFFGRNCEFVHTCQEEETPCENGGICLVVGKIEENRYSCRCPQGYTGINCSFETCDSNPCKHSSVCSMKNSSSFECNCTSTGYAGLRCENLINYADCRQQSCFGNMTCDPLKCECDTIDCEKIFMQIKSRPREIVYHLVIWPLLIIMLSLLIILFSIFAMRIKKSRATRGTYSPSRHEQQASRIEFNMDLKIPPEERLI